MQASFTFSLPEEQQEFDVCSRAQDWRSVVVALQEELRIQIKHKIVSDEELNKMSEIKEFLNKELAERGLFL